MAGKKAYRVKTIGEFHRLKGLPQPGHPLISVIDYSEISCSSEIASYNWVFDFYQISIKRGLNAKLKYGQQNYDFDEGVMFFIAPNQVLTIEPDPYPSTERSGWMLLIHPDFFWNTSLAKNIRQHEYFDYSVNEALFLSDKEEAILNTIVQNIQQEYRSNMDDYSQDVIIAQIELLLTYAERFYHRQFLTRKIGNHQILNRLDAVLIEYFNSDDLIYKGLPKVQVICERLNVSVSYLSRVLKILTGQSTQQHIHERLVEKAKEKLSTTNLSVSEIAYELGFEHPQSFSKLFKSKTRLSPLQFRQSFN